MCVLAWTLIGATDISVFRGRGHLSNERETDDMKTRLLIAAAAMAFATCALGASPTMLKLQKGGATVPVTTPLGGAPLTTLEQDPAMTAGDADSGDGDELGGQPVVNRSIAHGHAGSNRLGNARRAKSNPQLLGGFDGLNFHDQRFANGGNQFSVEPPDQNL